jgi:CIC family chloride channel protein
LTRENLQTIVRAGAAAGIAAAFRSPAGAVLLTLEVFGARFNQDLTAIAIAAGLGYVTRTALLGDAYPFHPSEVMQPVPLSALLLVVPVMGLVGAPTGYLFIRLFERLKTVFPARWPLSANVALGGFLVGVIGIWFPQVLSVGYPMITRSLNGGMAVHLFVILLLLKMLATSITFGSGAVGGLFAPTLVIGALFGGAFGYGIHAVAPQAVPQPELFVLLGMVVMFGSIVKGYWSGLLMVADMSGCYHQLLLPGVIAGGISFFVSWEMHDRSIFGLAIDPSAASPPEEPPPIRGG